ncbi:phospholipase D family protein [Simiduia curdlanivorans]|uniref:Phospholipase D family protein n=1 Tax=Simiduia curdlanivorans TaxID=1492769 RepID=A0ABV8UYS9_9GAMM
MGVSYRLFSLVSLVIFQLGCASLPEQEPRPEVLSFKNTQATRLGELAAHINADTTPPQQAFIPLNDGREALVARLALILQAEKSIDVQYYLYHNDTVGRLFTQYLIEASQRGVRVRLLVDDMATNWRDKDFAIIDQYPNIEVRLFNPFSVRGALRSTQFLFDFSRVNHRMHNKALIVDNQMAIAGGRNIGNQYFSKGGVQFADMDMLVTASATEDLSNVFDRYWNSDQVYPISQLVPLNTLTEQDRKAVQQVLIDSLTTPESKQYVRELVQTDFYRRAKDNQLRWFYGSVDIYADPPDKRLDKNKDAYLISMLKPSLDSAKKSLFILSPYFVPGDQGVAYLAQKVKQGVEVTVVTNSLAATDVSAVHAGYSRYRQALLEAGVVLYEIKAVQGKTDKHWLGSSKSSLHAKTYIVDEHTTFVGSMNLDPRSIEINTETGVIFHDTKLAKHLLEQINSGPDGRYWQLRLHKGRVAWFESDNFGREPDFTTEPQTSFLNRVWITFIGLFPIESQL